MLFILCPTQINPHHPHFSLLTREKAHTAICCANTCCWSWLRLGHKTPPGNRSGRVPVPVPVPAPVPVQRPSVPSPQNTYSRRYVQLVSYAAPPPPPPPPPRGVGGGGGVTVYTYPADARNPPISRPCLPPFHPHTVLLRTRRKLMPHDLYPPPPTPHIHLQVYFLTLTSCKRRVLVVMLPMCSCACSHRFFFLNQNRAEQSRAAQR